MRIFVNICSITKLHAYLLFLFPELLTDKRLKSVFITAVKSLRNREMKKKEQLPRLLLLKIVIIHVQRTCLSCSLIKSTKNNGDQSPCCCYCCCCCCSSSSSSSSSTSDDDDDHHIFFRFYSKQKFLLSHVTLVRQATKIMNTP